MYSRAPGQIPPKDLVSILVELTHVTDLTDPATSPVDPRSPFLTGDKEKDLAKCRDLADIIRQAGNVGIIAPSAAAEGEKNLIIYIDGIAGRITLEDGGERIPIRL
jgi:hypothetical protein